MIKRIVQKMTTKNMEKSEIFFQSGDMKKKSRLRAFARTQAKNIYFKVKEYFQWSNYSKWSKEQFKKIKTKKNREIGEFYLRLRHED